VSQLPLFRPRVSLRGIRGTVLDSWSSDGGHDAIVRFDGPTEWVGPPMGMRDVAGCTLLVVLAKCEALP
jgi:hypothetical protein